MWDQVYVPVAGSLPASAAVAALPIVVLLIALGVFRMPAWKSGSSASSRRCCSPHSSMTCPRDSCSGPPRTAPRSVFFPIAWIVFWAVALYRLSGRDRPVRDHQEFRRPSDAGSSAPGAAHRLRLRRLHRRRCGIRHSGRSGRRDARGPGLLAVLRGRDLSRSRTPRPSPSARSARRSSHSLASRTCRFTRSSSEVGRICAPVSLFIPAYLMMVMGGWKALRTVWPAALVCGVCFAATQFLVSHYIGPYLTDILASLATMLGLVALLSLWKPRDAAVTSSGAVAALPPAGVLLRAWSPYILLGDLRAAVGLRAVQGDPRQGDVGVCMAGTRWADPAACRPSCRSPSPYAAKFTFNILSASGTSALFATPAVRCRIARAG